MLVFAILIHPKSVLVVLFIAKGNYKKKKRKNIWKNSISNKHWNLKWEVKKEAKSNRNYIKYLCEDQVRNNNVKPKASIYFIFTI